jgi:hypothetical protein
MVEHRIPNLFIIGAPKCGTTAMSHYLAGHPDIFMSEQAGLKEPTFYNTDRVVIRRRVESRAEYDALFAVAPTDAVYLGEASATYLDSEVAVSGILQDSPNARLIVLVRNPVEIVAALHNQHVKKGRDIHDLESAWKLQAARRHGTRMPPGFEKQRNDSLQYARVARLGEQVQRLFGRASPDQVRVIVYDDFKTSPQKVYQSLLEWLQLPDDDRVEFPVLNARVRYRSRALEESLQRLRRIRERLGFPGGLGIHAVINRFNSQVSRPPLEPAFRRELEEYFRDDVRLLSELIGRDLSHWVSATEAEP